LKKIYFYFKDAPIQGFTKVTQKSVDDLIIDALMGNLNKNVDFDQVGDDLAKREKARKKWDKLRNVF
jgi:hypothetical protein